MDVGFVERESDTSKLDGVGGLVGDRNSVLGVGSLEDKLFEV
jgi:hypothetical protein